MITTSVVVASYRTNGMLERFIDSYRETASDSELIVVDVDPITPFGLRNVPGDYIIMNENKGYATACNLASLECNGAILAFFNADVRLLPNTLSTSSALLDHPKWGVAGPFQYSSDHRVTHAGIFGTLDAPRHRAWKQPVSDLYRDIQEAITVSGSAYFVKRDCWNDLMNCAIWREMYPQSKGAFLPTFLYYEEEWVSYHARAHGWKVMYYGKAECIHDWHVAINQHGDRNCVKDSAAMFLDACRQHNIPRYVA